MGRSSKKLERCVRVSRNGNGKLGRMEKGLDGVWVWRRRTEGDGGVGPRLAAKERTRTMGHRAASVVIALNKRVECVPASNMTKTELWYCPPKA
jgi:hypothetical protein